MGISCRGVSDWSRRVDAPTHHFPEQKGGMSIGRNPSLCGPGPKRLKSGYGKPRGHVDFAEGLVERRAAARLGNPAVRGIALPKDELHGEWIAQSHHRLDLSHLNEGVFEEEGEDVVHPIFDRQVQDGP